MSLQEQIEAELKEHEFVLVGVGTGSKDNMIFTNTSPTLKQLQYALLLHYPSDRVSKSKGMIKVIR